MEPDDPDYEHLVGPQEEGTTETDTSTETTGSLRWSTPPTSPSERSDPRSPEQPEEWSTDEEFEIEKIVSRRRLGETDWQYRIRWTGYGKEDDFWKSEEQLEAEAPNLLAEYKREQEELDLGRDLEEMFRRFELMATRQDCRRRADRRDGRHAQTRQATRTRQTTYHTRSAGGVS